MIKFHWARMIGIISLSAVKMGLVSAPHILAPVKSLVTLLFKNIFQQQIYHTAASFEGRPQWNQERLTKISLWFAVFSKIESEFHRSLINFSFKELVKGQFIKMLCLRNNGALWGIILHVVSLFTQYFWEYCSWHLYNAAWNFVISNNIILQTVPPCGVFFWSKYYNYNLIFCRTILFSFII